MPKRSAEGLTLLSAVVCVLSLLLVGLSFLYVAAVAVPLGQAGGVGVFTFEGRLLFTHARPARAFTYATVSVEELRPQFDAAWANTRGIRTLGAGWGSAGGNPFLILPLWLLPLLTAIAPVRWWRKRRRAAGRGFAVDQLAATAA